MKLKLYKSKYCMNCLLYHQSFSNYTLKVLFLLKYYKFSDKFYVMVDLPGHGKSSHLPFGSYYSMFFYVDFVERIRKR